MKNISINTKKMLNSNISLSNSFNNSFPECYMKYLQFDRIKYCDLNKYNDGYSLIKDLINNIFKDKKNVYNAVIFSIFNSKIIIQR